MKISENSFEEFQQDLKDKMDLIKDKINQEQNKIDFFNAIFDATGSETQAKDLTERIYGAMENIKNIQKEQLKTVFESPMDKSLEILKSSKITPEVEESIKSITDFKKAFNDAISGTEIDWLKLRELIQQLPEDNKAAAKDIVDTTIQSNAKIVEDIVKRVQKSKNFAQREVDIKAKAQKDIDALGSGNKI